MIVTKEMVIIKQLLHTQTVTSEFIDHNNHMHDANYNIILVTL